jgi:hypothetical protein
MSELDRCRHCGYSQPTDAATCPGCGRKHPVVRREAPRRLPALASHLGLVGPARRARWMLVVTGWVGAAFALAATARLAMTFDDVSAELADTTPPRVTDLTQTIGWILVIALILSGVAVGDWVRRSRSNLTGLHLEPRWRSAWSLGGWALPGQTAQRERRQVDLQWRDTSSAVAPLPTTSHGRGWTRLPVSQVVMRWWAMWMAVPGGVAVLVVLLGDDFETSTIARELELVSLAAAMLLVIALRSTYDVIGIVSVAQAHRAEALLRDRDAAAATGSPRPKPEPLVVVDHELEEAGLLPRPRHLKASPAVAPSLTISDADLADYLADDGHEPHDVEYEDASDDDLADADEVATGTEADAVVAETERDSDDGDAEEPVSGDGESDPDDEPGNDVYDLSSYFVR